VIVEMPTVAQAARVAKAAGGRHLPAKTGGKLSLRVDVGTGFEAHRGAVEAVTVAFELFDGDGVRVPSGWDFTGASFEVEWPTDPARCAAVKSHLEHRPPVRSPRSGAQLVLRFLLRRSSSCLTGSPDPRQHPFRSGQKLPYPASYTETTGGGPAICPVFLLPFGHRHSLLGSSISRWRIGPPSRSAYPGITRCQDPSGVPTFHTQ
jgi:hypothetical protein